MAPEHAAVGHRSRCPMCGLELHVRAGGTAPLLAYDFPEWARLCKMPASGGPSMCLALTAGPVSTAPAPVRAGRSDPSETRRMKARL